MTELTETFVKDERYSALGYRDQIFLLLQSREIQDQVRGDIFSGEKLLNTFIPSFHLAKKSDHTTKSAPPKIENRKARHEFHIDETFEAGIVLKGTEVKSIRAGKASLHEAFAYLNRGEVWLKNMYIKPYEFGSYHNHDERRERKLLLKRKEIREIDKRINQKGYTLVPLKLYFKGGYAKILLGLARGKKMFDKREHIKEKDVKRELDRKIKGSYSINL